MREQGVCFYHASDFDGQCSGALIRYNHPDVELIGLDYGDPYPIEKTKGRDVWMVDYSPQPVYMMIQAAQAARNFVWIDHHKSAIEEWGKQQQSFEDELATGKIRVRLDSELAACELTWKYLYGTPVMPEAVHLLGRYDVWDHSDPKTKPFQLGMKAQKALIDLSHKESAIEWAFLFNGAPVDTRPEFLTILLNGETIQRYVNNQNASSARGMAFNTTLDGLRCVALNKMGGSPIFESVYDPLKHDCMLGFALRGDGLWTVSLYSTKLNVDVSVVAKHYDGGGHKGAAGFQCMGLPFRLPMDAIERDLIPVPVDDPI
jgi:oligoribonuclease NrnB/cAMP/cGMP phosphodiesterase (DHH superfamily)